MKLRCSLAAAGMLWLAQATAALAGPAAGAPWGDQGDGTYANPVLPGDFSDIDAIGVGGDYYAISSTFQFSPGMAILHSRDLVNWNIVSHAVEDLTRISPEMNWDRMNRYGNGIWAGAIRHHAGRFWIYFGTPQEGYFMTTAANPAGPWTPPHRVLGAAGWDDCCPFWDDDGQGYLVGTHFKDKYNIHLFKLTPDGRELVKDSDTIIHAGENGSEANKLYKIKGLYYHLYSHTSREGRVVMMQRAKSLAGPWENRQLNHVSARVDREPNQGGLVQTQAGDWWFLTHQGSGGHWEGRAACLLPVTWVEGWPVIGEAGPDGIGTMVWTHKKPVAGPAAATPRSADVFKEEFAETVLPPRWEWNYQPRSEMWSLSERPGFLRLHAYPALARGNFFKAGNTLTQRSFRTAHNEATIRLDLGAMADGQQAGLCHFAKTYSTLGVTQSGGKRLLTFNDNGKITAGPEISTTTLWLKSSWGPDGLSRYAYSTDGRGFKEFGDPYQLTWGNYRGDRIGIFTYNDEGARGAIDVDWFHYGWGGPPEKEAPPPNTTRGGDDKPNRVGMAEFRVNSVAPGRSKTYQLAVTPQK